ncbi:hypothetical protein ACHAWF_015508 [Thalassiosira exigua]
MAPSGAAASAGKASGGPTLRGRPSDDPSSEAAFAGPTPKLRERGGRGDGPCRWQCEVCSVAEFESYEICAEHETWCRMVRRGKAAPGAAAVGKEQGEAMSQGPHPKLGHAPLKEGLDQKLDPYRNRCQVEGGSDLAERERRKRDEACEKHAEPKKPPSRPPKRRRPRPPPPPPPEVSRNFTQEERRLQICIFLRSYVNDANDGVVHGAFAETAAYFNVCPQAVGKLYRRHKRAILSPFEHVLDVKRKKGSGKPRKYTAEEVRRRVEEVPGWKTKTTRALASETGLPKSTMCRLLKQGAAERATEKRKRKKEERKLAGDEASGLIDAPTEADAEGSGEGGAARRSSEGPTPDGRPAGELAG